MNRCLAFLCALLCASLSVASACAAAPAEWLQFTIEPARSSGEIKATFRDGSRHRGDSYWSSNFRQAHLVGLDVSSFRASGTRPIRFAIIREAGRLDCAGNGGDSRASGNCRFTPDEGFMRLLEARGIGRPSREQTLGLMAVNARREIIDAVAAARYPTPTIDDLMALTAVGVDGRYIAELARVGYRPSSIDTLVQFRALDITPAYIGGFVRSGYANMDPDDLVQLKALDITPEFIAGFERLGYRNLSADTLVQLKALDITPEFVRSVERRPGTVRPVSELVQLKIFGNRRR